ncbi:MAG TPA: type II toxin-antitoxin system PemK/MazF family toxin [Pirellulales bacterium]|nr:type II toxin-antitoxin system PemK/MazF family toxin [Pirellulales bacterium]
MDRGDIYHISLAAEAVGTSHRRFVLVVSPRQFNHLLAPLVCPIKQSGCFARHRGFAVPLGGATRTQGVVLCNQPRLLNIEAHRHGFTEKAPLAVVEDVLARLATLLE